MVYIYIVLFYFRYINVLFVFVDLRGYYGGCFVLNFDWFFWFGWVFILFYWIVDYCFNCDIGWIFIILSSCRFFR